MNRNCTLITHARPDKQQHTLSQLTFRTKTTRKESTKPIGKSRWSAVGRATTVDIASFRVIVLTSRTEKVKAMIRCRQTSILYTLLEVGKREAKTPNSTVNNQFYPFHQKLMGFVYKPIVDIQLKSADMKTFQKVDETGMKTANNYMATPCWVLVSVNEPPNGNPFPIYLRVPSKFTNSLWA